MTIETKPMRCLVDPDCPFEGQWADVLEHAPVHPIPHPDQRAQWLSARRTFIGASEVGSVAGLTAKYKTALDVYVDKADPVGEPDALAGRARIGLVLEPALLADFATRHKVVLTRPASRRHPDHSFIAATPDALVEGSDYGVQVKVVGHNASHWWTEGPPQAVQAQVQTEMAVFGLERVVVLAMIDTAEPEEYEIKRDPSTFDYLAELCGMFWRTSIVPRELPVDFDDVLSIEAVSRAYPKALRQLEGGTLTELRLALSYSRAQAQAKELEARVEKMGAELRATIGDREGFMGLLERANIKATWKAPAGSPSWKAIAEEVIRRVQLVRAACAPSTIEIVQKMLDALGDPDKIIAENTPTLGARRLVVHVKE